MHFHIHRSVRGISSLRNVTLNVDTSRLYHHVIIHSDFSPPYVIESENIFDMQRSLCHRIWYIQYGAWHRRNTAFIDNYSYCGSKSGVRKTNNFEIKTFLIVSCLLATAAAISTENLSKLSEAWKCQTAKCGKQYGYRDLTLLEIYAKQDTPPLSNTPCLHDCVQKSLGVLTLSGTYGPKLREHIDSIFADQSEVATKLKHASTRCEAVAKKYVRDVCAMAYHFSHCFLHSNDH